VRDRILRLRTPEGMTMAGNRTVQERAADLIGKLRKLSGPAYAEGMEDAAKECRESAGRLEGEFSRVYTGPSTRANPDE